jgi:AraC-like DNA-binding protein/quercetin dioxygenase-like cupin family protein
MALTVTVLAVTVSARSAKVLPSAARLGLVDMRGGAPVRAGTFAFHEPGVSTGWHSHDLHQIEYAFEGVAEVETATTHHLLTPQQAMWIPAALSHRTTLSNVRSIAVFFEPAMVAGADDRVRVLAATPLLREMIVFATRWPIDRPASDPVADVYFDALAALVHEWLEHESPLSLPTSDDPVVRAVMEYTDAHLADVCVARVCAHAGVSERSLRRKFAATANMTWREYLLQSRLLRAMALLADARHSVLDVSTAVGFESVSAFTRAFNRLAGETPTAYRRRAVAVSSGA